LICKRLVSDSFVGFMSWVCLAGMAWAWTFDN